MAGKSKWVKLDATSDAGRDKIRQYTDKWEYRGEIEGLRYIRDQGPSIVVRSRDGSKIIFIKKQNDPNFKFRMV